MWHEKVAERRSAFSFAEELATGNEMRQTRYEEEF